MGKKSEELRTRGVGRAAAELAPIEMVLSESNTPLQPEVESRFRRLINRVKGRVAWTRIKLLDVRDETGALMKRCVVQLRLRHAPQVLFAVTAESAREALAEATARLERVLARRLAQSSPCALSV
jgi:hypothetical protein